MSSHHRKSSTKKRSRVSSTKALPTKRLVPEITFEDLSADEDDKKKKKQKKEEEEEPKKRKQKDTETKKEEEPKKIKKKEEKPEDKLQICSTRYCVIDKKNHIRVLQWLWPQISLVLPCAEGETVCEFCTKVKKLFETIYASRKDLLYISEGTDDESDLEDPTDALGHKHQVWLINAENLDEEAEILLPKPVKHESSETWTNRALNFIKKQFYLKNIRDEEQLAKIKERATVAKKVEDDLIMSDEPTPEKLAPSAAKADIKPPGDLKVKNKPITSILAGMKSYKSIDEWEQYWYQKLNFERIRKLYLDIESGKEDPGDFFFDWWTMGAGKTSILKVIQQLQPTIKYVKIVCEITLIEQWITGDCGLITLFPALFGSTTYDFIGFDEYRRQYRLFAGLTKVETDEEAILTFDEDDWTIIDEIQKYANVQPNQTDEMESYLISKMRIFLTGTPIMESPENIYYLNQMAGISPIRPLNVIHGLQVVKYGKADVSDDDEDGEGAEGDGDDSVGAKAKVKSKKRNAQKSENFEKQKLNKAIVKEGIQQEALLAKEDRSGIPREFHYTVQINNPKWVKWLHDSWKVKVPFNNRSFHFRLQLTSCY